MQLEVVVAMERRPVIVHGHAGSLIGQLRGKAVIDQCI